MTRINAGIPPRQLSDKHLLAEHREIKRIPNALSKYRCNLNIKDIPKTFTFGTGHVRFFYDKGFYTLLRYLEIYKECIRRGFNVTSYRDAWDIYKAVQNSLWRDYKPTEECIRIVQQRLLERDPEHYTKIFKSC